MGVHGVWMLIDYVVDVEMDVWCIDELDTLWWDEAIEIDNTF